MFITRQKLFPAIRVVIGVPAQSVICIGEVRPRDTSFQEPGVAVVTLVPVEKVARTSLSVWVKSTVMFPIL